MRYTVGNFGDPVGHMDLISKISLKAKGKFGCHSLRIISFLKGLDLLAKGKRVHSEELGQSFQITSTL